MWSSVGSSLMLRGFNPQKIQNIIFIRHISRSEHCILDSSIISSGTSHHLSIILINRFCLIKEEEGRE